MAFFSGAGKVQLAIIAVLAAIPVPAIVVGLLLQPTPLFAHNIRHAQFVVHSDKPLAAGWEAVLGDAQRRLSTSDLYDREAEFRIFVCNATWRLLLLTRSAEVGGFADTFATRNIYLREIEVAENRIVPPRGSLADAEIRSLSYFVAHEAAHVMQSRTFGRFVSLKSPKWIVEGHADYVAKAGEFHFDDNRQRLIDGDALVSENYARRGLYRRYHLMVEQSFRTSGYSERELFVDPPSEGDILSNLLSAADASQGM